MKGQRIWGPKPRLIHNVGPARVARRTFLRGSLAGVGVSLGLPLLDVMLNDSGSALASGASLPLRYGVFHWGCGVVQSTWVPKQTGMKWDPPDSLVPFADAQLLPYLTVISGTCHAPSRPGHAPAAAIALSSSHDMQRGGDGYRGRNHPEPTTDAIVADAWKGQTPIEHLGIGICRKGPYTGFTSWHKGGAANRPEPSPQKLFNRLFGSGPGLPTTTGDTPSAQDNAVLEATTAFRSSMLDALKEHLTTFSHRVGTADKQRIEQHLEGVRAIERQLQARAQQKPSGPGCTQPEQPGKANYGDGSTHEEKEAKSQVMSRLLAVALACDLTRVFHYEWSANQSLSDYPELGIGLRQETKNGKVKTEGHHAWSHRGDVPEMRKITRFVMKNLAYLGAQLRDQPDGSGNLLDRTLILGTSSHANADTHAYHDFPYLFLGTAGGRIKAGQHYRDPKPGRFNDRSQKDAPQNLNSPKVLLTAVRAVGVNRDKLGHANSDGQRVASDVISDLMA